ncbi:MAG: 3'-5' exoribonuclease [Bacteroidaceae bacterium]|nr:3'-5' exoribonuclease [Bacteroidaceae bacterium]
MAVTINFGNFNDPTQNLDEKLLPRSTFNAEDDKRDYALDAPFAERGINFVAIDLETATQERDSICEIGITVVEDSQVKVSRSWLVQPPCNQYDYFNIEIHGIRPEDTASSPHFAEIWQEVLPYVQGKVVVAHNTSFDAYVLRDSFLWNNMPFPDFPFFCSYRISTRVVRDCYSYSLPYVCEAVGVAFGHHHRAEGDARGCAELFLKLIELSGATSFANLQETLAFRCGRFSDKYFRPQFSTYKSKNAIKANSIVGDPSKIDEGSYFYGKTVCFTGKCIYGTRVELQQKIADIGGIPCDNVTKTTDILVVGQQDYRIVGDSGMSGKQKKAMKMKDDGFDIEIMSEQDFLANI